MYASLNLTSVHSTDSLKNRHLEKAFVLLIATGTMVLEFSTHEFALYVKFTWRASFS